MQKLILALVSIFLCFDVVAEIGSCQLPEKLEGYTLFFDISGMDYKTSPHDMIFRQLTFSKQTLNNKSLIKGGSFDAYYTYTRYASDIAFIDVYEDLALTLFLYRDVIVCQTNIVGKLIFTPSVKVAISGFSKQQITGGYVLRKTNELL